MILPYILHPNRIIGHSKTLIDNILSSHISKEAICGNLTSAISDHLTQFLIMPSFFSDPSSSKSNVSEFFKTNMNIIKNTWKGIRNLISWKKSASPYIHLLSQDNETVTNPKKIVNIFNDYFSTIAEKTKAKVRFSNKSFDGFLQHANENFFFAKNN